jgi:prepilin peptidase CpaA
MSPAEAWPLAVVALATLIAAATDLWKFKVYNVLTGPTLLAGLVASSWLGGLGGFLFSLLGVLLGFGLLIGFNIAGGVGDGDVKLLAAIGAWLGPQLTFEVFLASSLFGGAYSAALVIARGGWLALLVELMTTRQALAGPGGWKRPASDIEAEVLRPDRRRRLVPFAAMTCLGYFATLAWWGSDLDRVWPPQGRGLAVSSNVEVSR